MPTTEPIPSRDSLDAFASFFGHRPSICGTAPGRLNLVGEHTDYNGGLVLPVAIDRRTMALLSSRPDSRFVCHSLTNGETVEVPLDDLEQFRNQGWFSYVAGVASLLRREGIPIRGTNCLISSTIPLGAGLSSSAALEVSVAGALLALAERSLPVDRTMQLCQLAEWDWAGVSCGIMDQFISSRGTSDTALLIDCRTLTYESIPVDASLTLTVCDTSVPHTLAASEYNTRRRECEQAVTAIRKTHEHISSLRDVSMEMLRSHEPLLDPVPYKRARHVITENARVLEAGDALWYKDHRHLGSLMNSSHESLRDDYHVSCPELDTMAELCRSVDGVFGARMVGAGFGGSVIAISGANASATVRDHIMKEYPMRTGIEPVVLTCRIGEGVRVIHLG